jgi:3-hydroxybutyryl-CoA dehydratase
MSKNATLNEGDVFEGPSKTLTDAHFLFFSALTGDVHPIHYDVEYAKTTPLGKPIAHVLLLVSLTALGALKGRERIGRLLFLEQGSRLLEPAVIGDTVRPVTYLERIWHDEAGLLYRFKTTVINQHGAILLDGFHIYRVLDHDKASGKS